MASTPELHEGQIAIARAQAWHQAAPSAPSQPAEAQPDAEPDSESRSKSSSEGTSSEPEASAGNRILTLEGARAFVNNYGLVLFAPRSLGAPAPSLVEATLGATKSSVTPEEAGTARSLVARLVAEGSALPLNLLGGPGDLPDFVVSTAAFPFVFTLRGDKGWKRAPETSGALKVTTLALHVFEVLTAKGALTVAEIVAEVGREITDSAVSRALSELWSLLRVIPSLPVGGGSTVWELTTTRFLKAVKAGANAGQPTALSALISLYLGQVYLATEDEICAYLSPLTARSRIRDVLHGLGASRQLSEAVLDGKTVLFLPDSLPDFTPQTDSAGDIEAPSQPEGEAAFLQSPGGESSSSDAPSTDRIRRFEGGADAGRDRGFRGKPLTRPGSARPASTRYGPGRFGPPRLDARSGESSDRAPRSSNRGPRGEERPSRSFGDRREEPSPGRPPREGAGERPSSSRPSFSRPWDEEKRNRPARPEGDRPSRPAFGAGDSRPPRREGGPGRPPFGDRARPSFGDRDRSSFHRERPGEAPPFRRREQEDGGARPFRSSFSQEGGAGARDSRAPRGDGGAPRREGGSPGFSPRRDNREGGDRPRPFRPSGDRPSGPFAPRKSSDRPARDEGARPGRPSGGGFRPREEGAGGRPRSSDRPPFRANGAGRSSEDRPSRPFTDRPARPFGDRPARPFGDRPSGDRPFGDRSARDAGRPRSGPSSNFRDRADFRSGNSSDSSRSSDRPSRGSAGAGGGGFKRAPGGFDRGPGGPNRGPGGPDRGPSRAPGGFKRGPGRKNSSGDRPVPPRRPEDEA